MLSKKATTPIAKGDRVSSHTSQLWATFCMKSPELEMSATSKRRRKFRCRIVRRGLISQVCTRVAAVNEVLSMSVTANAVVLQRLVLSMQLTKEAKTRRSIEFSSDIQFGQRTRGHRPRVRLLPHGEFFDFKLRREPKLRGDSSFNLTSNRTFPAPCAQLPGSER